MKEDKFYQKWWFWVILAIVFLGIIGVVVGNSEPSYYNEYIQCNADLNELTQAVEKYFDALEEYCALDYTNPICDTLE